MKKNIFKVLGFMCAIYGLQGCGSIQVTVAQPSQVPFPNSRPH